MGNSSSTTNKNSNTTTDPPKNGEESLNAKVGAKLGELLEPGSPLYTATLGTLQWQRDNYLYVSCSIWSSRLAVLVTSVSLNIFCFI